MTIIKSTPLHYRLHIADEAGKTIREIIKDYDPVKITDEDQETGEVRVRRFKIKNWDQIKEGI